MIGLEDHLKRAALQEGFELVGICRAAEPPHYEAFTQWLDAGGHASMDYLERSRSLRRHPESLLEGVRSILSVGMVYDSQPKRLPGEPRIARYALGRDYHKVLRGKLRKIGRLISQEAPEARWRVCVDSAPLLERDFAQLAGLGWFGKNTMLINSKLGSWFVLGFLLTTLDLTPDSPAVGSCGNCRKCVDACPTGAIELVEGRWRIQSSRCISYLTIEHRGQFDDHQARSLSGWTFGCDVCQEVCPFNEPRLTQPERAPITRETGFLQSRQWPNLRELTQIGEQGWDELTRGSAVRRAGWGGLRRNASANLAHEPDC